MKKPKSCIDCPAVKIKGNKIYCSCFKNLEADKTNYAEMLAMWGRCPLDWKGVSLIEEKTKKE